MLLTDLLFGLAVVVSFGIFHVVVDAALTRSRTDEDGLRT